MSSPSQPRAWMPPRPPAPPPWSRELTTVGVTGTNGKTTTTALVASVMSAHHRPVPRVTTVGAFLDESPLELPETYEGFIAALRAGRDRGARYAAIELTSEALAMGFAKAWPCTVGVFTNLTRDHLDAHGSAEHYLASKAQLFVHLPADGTAVLNGCDPASELLSEVVGAGARVLRYGAPSRGPACAALDLHARHVVPSWKGTTIAVDVGEALATEVGARELELELASIGEVFAENALAACAAALALGVPVEVVRHGIAAAPRPPGRFEVVASAPRVVVDYAHTPDSLRRTLETARRLGGAELWVVFGAGGERDQAKRAQMGEAASVADRVVLTSDNPRGEDPAAIAAAIREGVDPSTSVDVELDRAAAIRATVREAARDDIVIIAGKGHETEQVVGALRRRFSDHDVVQAALGSGPDDSSGASSPTG